MIIDDGTYRHCERGLLPLFLQRLERNSPNISAVG